MLGHIRKVLPLLHADVATANLQDFGRAVVGILLLSQQAPHGWPISRIDRSQDGYVGKAGANSCQRSGMVRKTLWVP